MLAIGAEVDVLRGPLLALPQLVELLRLEQLQFARLLLGSERPGVALLRQIEEAFGHGIAPGSGAVGTATVPLPRHCV